MRSGMVRVGRVAFVAATAAVCVVGIHWTSRPAEAAKPCPLIYAPVKCDNGKTYTNQCLADRARATGCVPIGVFPP